jgi:hypothetical protein
MITASEARRIATIKNKDNAIQQVQYDIYQFAGAGQLLLEYPVDVTHILTGGEIRALQNDGYIVNHTKDGIILSIAW